MFFSYDGCAEEQSLAVNPWQPLGSCLECVIATLGWNVFQYSEEKTIKMSAKASRCDVLSFGVCYLLKGGCNVLLLRWWSLGREEPLDFSYQSTYKMQELHSIYRENYPIQPVVMSENSGSLLLFSKEPGAGNAAVRQRGRQHQREPEENRPAPLQGFLAAVSGQFKGLVWKGTPLRMYF